MMMNNSFILVEVAFTNPHTTLPVMTNDYQINSNTHKNGAAPHQMLLMHLISQTKIHSQVNLHCAHNTKFEKSTASLLIKNHDEREAHFIRLQRRDSW